MTIVSLSLPSQLIEDLDTLQKSGGYAGRSELLRAAIRMLLEDSKEKHSLKGHINAVEVVTHDESNEEPITRLKHQYEDIVKTHIHSKISQNNCVEVFLLEGEGKKIGQMAAALQREDKLRSVKLVVM